MSIERNKYKSRLVIIACSALFIAISIICGKYLAFSVGSILRFSFENLPIILSGVLFGPVIAVICAVLADVIGCMLVGYDIIPLVLMGGAVIGFISGIISKLLKSMPLAYRLAITVFSSHALGSVIIKTIGIADRYLMPIPELMLWRILNYLLVGILEYILLLTVLKSKAVRSQLELTLNKKI